MLKKREVTIKRKMIAIVIKKKREEKEKMCRGKEILSHSILLFCLRPEIRYFITPAAAHAAEKKKRHTSSHILHFSYTIVGPYCIFYIAPKKTNFFRR